MMSVPDGPPYCINGAYKAVSRCDEHHWSGDSVIVEGLCPIGRIEMAVEEGLAKLKAASL
jgi:hypothetical protein